jgi:hypothetical protein
MAPDPVVPVNPDAETMDDERIARELQEIFEERHPLYVPPPGPTEAMDRRLATTLWGMPGASNTMDYPTAQAQHPELFTPSVVATAGVLVTASEPGAQSQGDTGSSSWEAARPEVPSSSSSGTSGAAQSVLVNHLRGDRIVSVPSLVRRVPLRAPTPSVPTPSSSEDDTRDFYPDSRASGDFYEE